MQSNKQVVEAFTKNKEAKSTNLQSFVFDGCTVLVSYKWTLAVLVQGTVFYIDLEKLKPRSAKHLRLLNSYPGPRLKAKHIFVGGQQLVVKIMLDKTR